MQTQTVLLAVCALLFIVAVPLVFRLVPPNRIYGFRTFKTLSHPDLWYRANVFAGYALLLAAAVTALIISCGSQLSEEAYAVILVVLILCATAA